jgi:hypothetical protein
LEVAGYRGRYGMLADFQPEGGVFNLAINLHHFYNPFAF